VKQQLHLVHESDARDADAGCYRLSNGMNVHNRVQSAKNTITMESELTSYYFHTVANNQRYKYNTKIAIFPSNVQQKLFYDSTF